MTRREELNEEIKKEIRNLAERLCSILDSNERLLQLHEANERNLAEALDRVGKEAEMMVQ